MSDFERPDNDFLDDTLYREAASRTVNLGNQLADDQPADDPRAIADGLLAGAIHYWLYAYTPCGNPQCPDCAPIGTASLRLHELLRLSRELAEDSEYYQTPNDRDVGRA